MKKKFAEVRKLTAFLMSIAMGAGMMPASVSMAVSGNEIAKDGTYVGTAAVQPDEDQDFEAYDLKLNVSVSDGKISSIEVANMDEIDEDNHTYINKALSGKGEKKGISQQICGLEAASDALSQSEIDIFSGATCTSNAMIEAVKLALAEAPAVEEETQETPSEPETPETSAEPETPETPAEPETPETSADPETPEETSDTVYAMMNIPYADFYEAEIVNPISVDVVSSATTSKSVRFANTYYEQTEEGVTIKGVTAPVSMDEETYNTIKGLVTDSVADYYISEVLESEPASYKEVSYADGDYSFGAMAADEENVTESTDTEASLSTSTPWGDYLLVLSEKLDASNVYGAYITTTDGTGYAMRHEENIWSINEYYEFAWSTGITTTEPHGNTLSYEHYQSIMGKDIASVTWLCADGVRKVILDPAAYAAVKTDVTVSVEDAKVPEGTTTVTLSGELPADFEAVYAVDGLEASVKEGVLTYAGGTPGQYTLIVSDASGKYADLSARFVLSTADLPAAYDSSQTALVAAEGFTDADLSAYIKNISKVSVNGTSYNASGKRSVKIINEDGSINLEAKSGDTAIFGESGTYELVVTATGYENDLTFTLEYTAAEEYKYVYAGLTWAEYWAAEDVYAAGSTASSDEVDQKGESDKGAFDVVSRATANHGLHRGSFQCMATIYDTDGGTYEVAYWITENEETKLVLTDGSSVGFSKGEITKADGSTATMDHYEVRGIKYVPVKVAAADYEAFCEKYTVVENDGTLAGGYSENQLESFTAAANVTEETNGLKTAVKNEDGTFSFTERTAGTDSGLADTALRTAENIEVTVKEASGSYGEFLRVDLTGDGYGALGANMQAVKWTYYGDDSTYTNALASYGTKFAADNWMHKSMGIQLGLTDSLRCQLPEGTDGTGYWELTVYALGYADYTIRIQAADENIVKEKEEDIDTSALEEAIRKAEALSEEDYTAESWAAMQTELEEAKAELESPHSQAAVEEAAAHLNAAIDALVEKENSVPIVPVRPSLPGYIIRPMQKIIKFWQNIFDHFFPAWLNH